MKTSLSKSADGQWFLETKLCNNFDSYLSPPNPTRPSWLKLGEPPAGIIYKDINTAKGSYLGTIVLPQLDSYGADRPSLYYKWAIQFRSHVEGNCHAIDFTDTNLRDIHLGGIDFSGSKFHLMENSTFYKCIFDDCQFPLADMTSCTFDNCSFVGANLGYADMRRCHFDENTLSEFQNTTVFDGLRLISENPILQIGPIGSRHDYLLAFMTDKGVVVNAGCFRGTLKSFQEQVRDTHANNPEYMDAYEAAIRMIRSHAKIEVNKNPKLKILLSNKKMIWGMT